MTGERIFGDYIHRLRIEKGDSLRKAAMGIGVSAMYLSELESGKKIPAGKTTRKIADYYDVDYMTLSNLCNKSKEVSESSKVAVARIASGLSEEDARRVLEYMQNLGNVK